MHFYSQLRYRDQDSLYIFDGPTGDVKFQTPCRSATHIEMPIIADIDADGETEMLITCGSSALDGNVIAFKSANDPWSKSRPVWNQHAFFNTNINDDLSIPIQQQNPNIVRDSIVMNTFLNQYSSPAFPLPDLEITSMTATCTDPSIIINTLICNVGDATSDAFPLSVYEDDPTSNPITNGFTIFVDELLSPGQCTTISFTTDIPPGGFVYAVASDDQSVATPFSIINLFPVTALQECNYLNNILGTFVQNQNIVSVVDTMICVNDSVLINNIGVGADADTTFTFKNSFNCDSLVRYIVSTFPVPLSSEERLICPEDSLSIFGDFVNTPGSYQQVNIGSNGCDSIAEIILLHNSIPIIDFTITNSCANVENGGVQAMVAGGTLPYVYDWSTGAQTDQITDLSPGLYALTVTDFLGCISSASVELQVQMIAFPDWLVTSVNCPGEENGLLTINNTVPGFSYAILPDDFQDTALFENLAAGDYLLTVRNPAGCLQDFPFSIPEAVEIQVEVSEDQTISLGNETRLRSFLFGENLDTIIYQWSPENQLSCVDCPSPVANPYSDTAYKLTITDRRGCTASASVLITVNQDKAVYIPNAFSPNADGINDYFIISTNQSVARIQSLRIYNRWGAVIYEQSQFPPNDFTFGWDGSFKNQVLNSGVYVYLAVIEFVDQTTQQYSGDISLFR